MNLENYIKSVLSGLKTWIQFTFAKKSDLAELYYTEQMWKYLAKDATATYMRTMDNVAYGINMFITCCSEIPAIGTPVKIEWADIIYECTVKAFNGMPYAGNLTVADATTGNTSEDTGEPFMVVFVEEAAMFYTLETSTENRIVSIQALIDVVHQIANKYIPLATSNEAGAVHPYTSTETGGDVWMNPTTGRLYAADSYVLPTATSSVLGGVKPVTKTTSMTQSVGVDSSGKLYTNPPVPPVQSDFLQTDSADASYIKNKPRIGEDYVILSDISTGDSYVIRVKNGNLISDRYLSIMRIEIISAPTKTEYTEGEPFDLSGIEIRVVYEDGSSKTTNVCSTLEEYAEAGNSSATVVYSECGNSVACPFDITVIAFDPAVVLIDFAYTANSDGTYTITGWNGTLNGVESTEMVVPDNHLIIL